MKLINLLVINVLMRKIKILVKKSLPNSITGINR